MYFLAIERATNSRTLRACELRVSETGKRCYGLWKEKKGESEVKVVNFQKANFYELSELSLRSHWRKAR